MICKCGCTEWKYMGNWPNGTKRIDGFKCVSCGELKKVEAK